MPLGKNNNGESMQVKCGWKCGYSNARKCDYMSEKGRNSCADCREAIAGSKEDDQMKKKTTRNMEHQNGSRFRVCVRFLLLSRDMINN